MGLRLDAGIILARFSRLGPDLGNISVYLNIGFDVLGFGRTRVFDIRKDK